MVMRDYQTVIFCVKGARTNFAIIFTARRHLCRETDYQKIPQIKNKEVIVRNSQTTAANCI